MKLNPLNTALLLLLIPFSTSQAENVSSLSGHVSSADILKSFSAKKKAKKTLYRSIKITKHTQDVPEQSFCSVSNTSLSLSIEFETNSYSLKKEGYETLAAMSAAMNAPELVNCNFMIEGHTDASGNATYNQKLSEQRAITVRNFLNYQNVEGTRLDTIGLGEARPLNAAAPYASENRRVQFKITNSI